MKWKELKEFADTLTAEQLQQDVIMWGDELSAQLIDCEVLDEDYINPSGEGCEPRSAYLTDPDPDVQEMGKDEKAVAQSGDVILMIDWKG